MANKFYNKFIITTFYSCWNTCSNSIIEQIINFGTEYQNITRSAYQERRYRFHCRFSTMRQSIFNFTFNWSLVRVFVCLCQVLVSIFGAQFKIWWISRRMWCAWKAIRRSSLFRILFLVFYSFLLLVVDWSACHLLSWEMNYYYLGRLFSQHLMFYSFQTS